MWAVWRLPPSGWGCYYGHPADGDHNPQPVFGRIVEDASRPSSQDNDVIKSILKYVGIVFDFYIYYTLGPQPRTVLIYSDMLYFILYYSHAHIISESSVNKLGEETGGLFPSVIFIPVLFYLCFVFLFWSMESQEV